MIAAALGVPLSPAMAGQGANPGGLFAAVVSGALGQQTRQQWQKSSAEENGCLRANKTSAEVLSNAGISPNDPRVKRLFAECARYASPPPQVVTAAAFSALGGAYNPDFAVDGLAAGGQVSPDSEAYRAYSCRPSTDYPGFQWCGRHRQMNGAAGPYESYVTIFHSPDYTAAFVLQDIVPAFFAPGDPEREIQRLSRHFGQAARIVTGEPSADALHSVIATWGDVTLAPLDPDSMAAVARGEAIHVGLVIDFLGNTRKSAQEGMPIFRIGGGAGYIWSAKWDDNGKGRLRITSVNASLLPGAVAELRPYRAQSPAPTPATTATAAPDPVRIEADREARADRAIAAANAQLEDAQAFVQEHRQSPQLLDYVERMNALLAAVKAGDLDPIERKSTELSTLLNRDKDYQQHLASVAEAQKRKAAQFLGDTLRQGEQQRAFIMEYIARNPLGEATPALAALVKQLVPLLQRQDLTPLQTLVEKIDLTIREANLVDAFVAAQREPPKAATSAADAWAAPTPSPAPVSAQIPITQKNRFLVEGDGDDVEILYNSSPSAPHVAQNLRGEIVFAGNQASVCLFGNNPEGFALGVKKTLLAAVAPKTVTIGPMPVCDPDHLLDYDVVATRRGAFLRAPRDAALSLIKAIETDGYKKFTTVAAAEISKAAEAEKTEIERIRNNVADGAPEGYGIVIAKTGSPNLCVATVDRAESHRELLLRAADKIGLDMQTGVAFSPEPMGVEDAFVALQKRQCGAVYASAAHLKLLTAALAHNGSAYTLSSLWLTPADIDGEDAAIAERKRIEAEDKGKRDQRNADMARLAAARAEDLDSTQAAQQAALRTKFGDRANGAAAQLGFEIIAWVQSPQGSVGIAYPGYAAWLADKLSEHWEVVTTNSALQDFGTSNFKARALETVFARVTLHLRNRILGEYEDACFLFGRINDAEFRMPREPVFARCDDPATITAWQSGHGFRSEWVVAAN